MVGRFGVVRGKLDILCPDATGDDDLAINEVLEIDREFRRENNSGALLLPAVCMERSIHKYTLLRPVRKPHVSRSNGQMGKLIENKNKADHITWTNGVERHPIKARTRDGQKRTTADDRQEGKTARIESIIQ